LGDVGTFVGSSSLDFSMTNNYWVTYPSQPTDCIGEANGGAATCTSLGTVPSTENDQPLANWDFNTVWKFPQGGGIPILDWEYED
jgi:hypothetical protein